MFYCKQTLNHLHFQKLSPNDFHFLKLSSNDLHFQKLSLNGLHFQKKPSETSFGFPTSKMDRQWCSACNNFRAISDFAHNKKGNLLKTCSKHAKHSSNKRPIDLEFDDWNAFICEIRAWRRLVCQLVSLIVIYGVLEAYFFNI